MGKKEVTKNRIIEAAKMLFAVQGYDAVSVTGITKKAGIGKGTFYYHFTKKEDLLFFLIEENFRVFFADLYAIRDNAGLSTVGKLEKIMRILFSRDLSPEPFNSYFRGMIPVNYESDIKNIRLKYLLPLITSIVNEGVKNGSFRIVNGQMIGHIMTCGITEFIYRNYACFQDDQYYAESLKGFEELFNVFLTPGSETVKLM